MHVARGRESAGPSKGVPNAEALEEGGRDREPCEGKPRERRQDEDPDEQPDRQEDEDADREGRQESPPRGTRPRSKRASADVREGEERRGEDKQQRLDLRPLTDRKLVEGRKNGPERKRRQEPAPVEPNRLGHELADGALCRRRALGIAEGRLDDASSLLQATR